MLFEFFLFFLFFLFLLFSAIMVISLENTVLCVFFLILTFCNATFLLLLIGSEFFSFLLLIVYVGAIAVLFLFVVMMLNVKIKIRDTSINYFLLPLLLLLVISIGDQFYNITTCFDFLIYNHSLLYLTSWFQLTQQTTNIKAIGLNLYTYYSFLFLIAGIILLVAMIGVIILTLHQKLNVKKQLIEFQLIRASKKSVKFINFR